MGAPLHSHFGNDTLRFQDDHLFSRTGQAFFLLLRFFPFFLSLFRFFFFFFFFLERDCLLCAIWLRACHNNNRIAVTKRKDLIYNYPLSPSQP